MEVKLDRWSRLRKRIPSAKTLGIVLWGIWISSDAGVKTWNNWVSCHDRMNAPPAPGPPEFYVALGDTVTAINIVPLSEDSSGMSPLFPLDLVIKNVGGQTASNSRIKVMYPERIQLQFGVIGLDSTLVRTLVRGSGGRYDDLRVELPERNLNIEENAVDSGVWMSVPVLRERSGVDKSGRPLTLVDSFQYAIRVSTVAFGLTESTKTIKVRTGTQNFFNQKGLPCFCMSKDRFGDYHLEPCADGVTWNSFFNPLNKATPDSTRLKRYMR